MAHFAQIDENNVVIQVIVAEQEFIDTLPDKDRWIQTSYNTYGGVHYTEKQHPYRYVPSEDQSKAFRKNYAGIGGAYDPVRDAFIPPKPFETWVLNEETCTWEPPVPKPTDGKDYYFDNESSTWLLIPIRNQA